MPRIDIAALPTFFQNNLLHTEEYIKQGGNNYQSNKPYTRNPNSTWVYRLVHSGGVNTIKQSFSCYIFFNNQPSIVVFNTSYKWIKKYAFTVSPGRSYLDDISTKGKSLFPTTTLSELSNYALNNPNVPQDVQQVVKFFVNIESTKSSLSQTDFLRKELGNFISSFKSSLKKQIGITSVNELLPLDELQKYKRIINKGGAFTKNPKGFLDKIKQQIINSVGKKSQSISFKTIANVGLNFIPGGKVLKATKLIIKTTKKSSRINTIRR